MAAIDAEREFSEKKHLSGDWQTAALHPENGVVSSVRRWSSFKLAELDRFSKAFATSDIIVDFGCGNGTYSRYCHAVTGAAVIAVDWSYAALRRVSRGSAPGIAAVCADLTALPFRNGCADGLYTIDVLGHLRDQEKALDEVARVCRPGAHLFLHAECADYRLRWPDRKILQRTGHDLTGERDGHVGIRMAAAMEEAYRRRFVLQRFYSPAGLTGWLTGYPDKYAAVLRKAKMPFCAAAAAMALVKKLPPAGGVLRIVNNIINRLELAARLGGGGSCFAAGTTLPEGAGNGGVAGDGALDIVIATLDRPAAVAGIVDALLPQCLKDDRILVVWQGRLRPPQCDDRRVTYLHRKTPSLPAARNAGVAAGKNPVVVFLDDDCEITEGFVAAHRRCYTLHAVEGVAGYVDDPLFTRQGEEPSLFNIANGDIRQQFNFPVDSPVISVMGANMSFSRSALLRTGGFDTRYRRNAVWEDIDMSFRMLNAGVRLQFCSGAAVLHRRTAAGGCRADRGAVFLFHYFANTAYFACTWAPGRYAREWLRYWWYRLEYQTRVSSERGKGRLQRHDMVAVAAGCAGAIAGIARFMIYGRRQVMPGAVAALSERYFGSGR